MRTFLLDEMTWPELAEAAGAGMTVVLPIGATEQHGPHLPLATDCLIPLGIALEAARKHPLVVAPPIRFGAKSRPLSGGGEGFPGTLSLHATTLLATIQEVIEGLARSGFRQVCVQSWHFENSSFVWEAAEQAVKNSPGLRVLLIEDPMPDFGKDELAELFPSGFPGWDVEHASVMETSLMYVLHPDLVLKDRIVDDAARRHPRWDLIPAPEDFIPASGVLSRPSEATEEIGHRFLQRLSDRLVEAIETEFGQAPKPS